MKPQTISIGLLLVAISFTSCKKNETVTQEKPVTATAPTQVDSTKQSTSAIENSAKVKEEKEEKESNEKNDKD